MTSILVDADVLVDIGEPRPGRFALWAAERLAGFAEHEPFVVNALVAAELACQFEREAALDRALPTVLWRRDPLPFAAACPAGRARRRYRERGGQRERTLPDVLVGARALVAGHRLLMRGGARCGNCFPTLDVVCPESHP